MESAVEGIKVADAFSSTREFQEHDGRAALLHRLPVKAYCKLTVVCPAAAAEWRRDRPSSSFSPRTTRRSLCDRLSMKSASPALSAPSASMNNCDGAMKGGSARGKGLNPL